MSWDELVDARLPGEEATILGEPHQVGEHARPGFVFLSELPVNDSVVISGFDAVDSPPAAGQFRVRYDGEMAGTVEFNLAHEGAAVEVDYSGSGSVLYAHQLNDLAAQNGDALQQISDLDIRVGAAESRLDVLEAAPSSHLIWGNGHTSITFTEDVLAIYAGDDGEEQTGGVARGFAGNFGNFFQSSVHHLAVYETLTLNGQIDATGLLGDITEPPPPFGSGELIQDSGTPIFLLNSNATRVPFLNSDLLDYYHATDLLDLAQHTGALPPAAIAVGSYELDHLAVKTEIVHKAGSTERRGTSTSGYARKMLGQVSFSPSTQRYVVIPLVAAFTGTVRVSVVNGSSSGSNIIGRVTKDLGINVTAAGAFAGGTTSSVWESWGLLATNIMIGEWEYDALSNSVRIPLVYVGTASRTLNVEMEIMAGVAGMAILDDATISAGGAIVNPYVREYRSAPDRLGVGKQPVTTLDINGNFGVGGIEVIASDRVIRNATFGGSMRGAAIADADGTLADLTSKFNVLLAQRRARGDQA